MFHVQKRWVLALLAFAQVIISIDYNIVFVALPDIGVQLGFSARTLQWVVSAYAVAFGGFLLLGGRASDLFGPRRTFVAGLALYGVSSLAGGLAAAPGVLVAARAVQGIGGAFLFPATLTLIGTTFAAGKERNRAFGVWATAGGSGMILGSLLGGVLTDVFGWTAVFFVNVPLAAVALALAGPLLGADTPPAGRRTFDVAGAVTATAGATLLLLTIVQGPESGWTNPLVLGSGLAGLVLLAAFATIERRGRDPLLPPALLRDRDLRVGVTVTFLFMATFGAVLYFLTVYFQTVHGYTPMRTGLAFLVPMAAIAAGSQTGGRIAHRLGARAVMTGSLALGGVGVLGLALTLDGTYAQLVPSLVLLGLGQGCAYAVMFGAATARIPARQQGIASGIASTGQQVGGAFGLAVLVAVAASGGIDAALFATAGGIALTALVALGFSARQHTTVTV